VHHATTHNIVIAIIQGGGIRHFSIHHPSLAFVLGSDEVLDFPVRPNYQYVVDRQLLFDVLTTPKEHGQVPVSPPNTCILLAPDCDDRSIGCDKLVRP
jgi:hypothetical protein